MFEVTEAGSYGVTARVTEGWSVDTSDPHWIETAPRLPSLAVFSASGSRMYGPNLLTSGDALREGITYERVDIEQPGSYTVRLGGRGQAPWSLEVVVVREGDIRPLGPMPMP